MHQSQLLIIPLDSGGLGLILLVLLPLHFEIAHLRIQRASIPLCHRVFQAVHLLLLQQVQESGNLWLHLGEIWGAVTLPITTLLLLPATRWLPALLNLILIKSEVRGVSLGLLEGSHVLLVGGGGVRIGLFVV